MPLSPTPAFLFWFTLVLASCTALHPKKPAAASASPATSAVPALPTDGSVLKLAQVEAVRAEVSPLQPSEAIVVISGLLHDGATRVHEVQQQRLADGFVLTVITARPAGAVATLALIPYERTLTLNLQGMPKGPCKIMANGVATTVMVP